MLFWRCGTEPGLQTMRRPAETHQPQHNVGTRRGVTTSPLRMHVDRSVARKEAKSQRRLARFARAEHTTLKKPCGGGGGTWALETSAVRASIALKQEARRAGAAAAANRWDWAAVHVRGAPTSRHANAMRSPQHFVLARRSRVVEGSVKLVPAQQAAPLYCALCLIKFMSTQGKHCARTRVVQWRRGSGGRGRAGRGGSGRSGI